MKYYVILQGVRLFLYCILILFILILYLSLSFVAFIYALIGTVIFLLPILALLFYFFICAYSIYKQYEERAFEEHRNNEPEMGITRIAEPPPAYGTVQHGMKNGNE